MPSRWPLAVLCLMLPSLATAAPPSDHYRVELIVFGTVEPAPAPAHSSPGPALPAAPPQVVTPTTPTVPATPLPPVSAGAAAALQQQGIQLLGDTDFTLQAEWLKLKHSAHYRPLVHLGWTQSRPPERGGPPVRFHVDDRLAGGLDGSVVLAGGALLHLNVHLSEAAAINDPTAIPNRLDELRRVRLDELHYLDSPHLGMLVRVSRAP